MNPKTVTNYDDLDDLEDTVYRHIDPGTVQFLYGEWCGPGDYRSFLEVFALYFDLVAPNAPRARVRRLTLDEMTVAMNVASTTLH